MGVRLLPIMFWYLTMHSMNDLRVFVLHWIARFFYCNNKRSITCFNCYSLVTSRGTPFVSATAFALILLQLSACATGSPGKDGSSSDSLSGNQEGALTDDAALLPSAVGAEKLLLSSATDKVTTARYPGTETPVDEISRRVAIDLVNALQEVFSERSLADEISISRPGNSFEYNLLEQLQLSGFNIFHASTKDPQALLSYSVELISSGVESVDARQSNQASFNDYAFSLQFDDFFLLRQYRVSEQAVQPLAPMLVFSDSDNGESNVVQTDDSVFACLLYTSPSPRDQRGSRMPSSA